MDQSQYSGNPSISHPYPPTYRTQLSPPNHTHQLDYQSRRQDRQDRQNQQLSVSDNPYIPSPSRSPDPSYSNNPNYNQPLYPDDTRPTTRLQRSASESSTYPTLPTSDSNSINRLENGYGKEYPEGWTKEDEDAEREFLKKGMIDWQKLKGWRFWIRKEWWYWYIIAIVAAVLVILMSLYHDQIVDWMTPFANWMKNLPGGWAIPIGIFFVLSFPPLFGQEILAVLVGVVWGLWVGFGITAAGTLLGEIGNFYAFKYCLRSTAEKYEKNNVNYACMAHVVREGGFWMIFIIRLSAIPGHFSTAVFATCGTGFWIFTIATILTLPKQLVVVYLGVIFASDEDTGSKEKWISHSVLIVGCLITIWAAWYIWKKMHQARVVVWRKRRIEAASKGMRLNDIPQSKEWDRPTNDHLDRPTVNIEEGDEDPSSPIMIHHRHNQNKHNAHQSYQNPYDIRYQSQDDMSVYHVDPYSHTHNNPIQTQSTQSLGLGQKIEIEQDIGYSYKPTPSTDSLANQPMTQFPEAKSTGIENSNLRREKTNATTYTTNGNFNDTAQFPIPLPAQSNVRDHIDHNRDHQNGYGNGNGNGYTLR